MLLCTEKKGNGWRIQKFHDILHLALDMERFGPPSNFDAGPHESGLKIWAKLPAQTSQKRGYNVFVGQVAARVFEFQCMSKAMRHHGIKGLRDKPVDKAMEDLQVRHHDDTTASLSPVLGGTTYRVYNTPPPVQTNDGKENNSSSVVGEERLTDGVGIFQQSERISRDKRTKSQFTVHPVVENFLRWQPPDEPNVMARTEGSSQFWELKTECRLTPPDDDKRITLRCHPNYQNEGPWYDWVLVNFQTDRFFHKANNKKRFDTLKRNKHPGLENEHDPMKHDTMNPDNCVPCKLLAFAERHTDGKTMALVHGCSFRTTNNDIYHDTVLVEFWRLEYHDLYKNLPVELRNPQPRGRKRAGQHDYTVPFLCWIDVASIVSRCFVIEEEPGLHEVLPRTKDKKSEALNWVMLMRPHSFWAEQFA